MNARAVWTEPYLWSGSLFAPWITLVITLVLTGCAQHDPPSAGSKSTTGVSIETARSEVGAILTSLAATKTVDEEQRALRQLLDWIERYRQRSGREVWARVFTARPGGKPLETRNNSTRQQLLAAELPLAVVVEIDFLPPVNPWCEHTITTKESLELLARAISP